MKDVGSNIHLNTKTGQNCLHIATEHGNFKLCKILLNNYNFNVDTSDNEGYTPLICSARSGNYEIFWYFIKMGGAPKTKNKSGQTCVHCAAKNGHTSFCKSVLDNFEFKNHTRDNEVYTYLHHSARSGNSELVKYFINTGGNIYLKTNDGKNCLYLTAEGGHISLCKIFLQKYIFDLRIIDRYGNMPLHYCAENGSYVLFKYLVQNGSDVYRKTNEGKSCLHLAAKGGQIDICKILLKKYIFNIHEKDQSGKSPLHYSATNGSFKYFVKMEIDIYQKIKNRKNCLHLAVKKGCVNLCNTLLEVYNLDFNVVGHSGKNPLNYSTIYGKYDFFQNFVRMVSNIYQKGSDGKNCLILAAQGGHLDICKTLTEIYNFDIDVVDCYGKSRLHYCAGDGNYELFQYLAEVGCKIYQKTKEDENCLILAAQEGHLDLCKRLVRKNSFDINIVVRSGQSFLHSSARNGNYQLFQFFLSMGSNINQKTNTGKNCLLLAAEAGCIELCKTLIEVYDFEIYATDNSGESASHFSAENGNFDFFQYFINMGSDINQKKNYGENCLILATAKGCTDLCKILINEYCFDFRITDYFGNSDLHYCVKTGNHQLFSYFFDLGSNINQRTNQSQNCLILAAEGGYMDFCKTFRKKYCFDVRLTDYFQNNALQYCAANGNHQLFHYFIKLGSHIYQRTKNGQNCLHVAPQRGCMDLCKKFIKKYNFEIDTTDNSARSALLCCAANVNHQLLQYLLKMGSNINQSTKSGDNCLHVAASHGYMDLCKTLVEKYNFDLHMTNFWGQTALHCCVTNINFELFQYFLKMDSNINQRTRDGKNCLHIAAEKGYMDLCKTFIDEFILDIHVRDNSGKSAMHYCAGSGNHLLFHYFVNIGSDINQRTNNGKNCLHIAAEKGYMDLCKTFIDEFNFDIHVTDNSGKSAMHYCAGSGSHQLFHYFTKMGSDVHQRTNNGQNCLHIAAARGYMDLCKMFLEEYNFDINVTDNSRRSALLCCAANGNDQLFQYFIKMGSNINQGTKYDGNCLHIAASHGNMDICKTLVEKYNFDARMTNFWGKNALDCCLTNVYFELFQYFLKMGSNINRRTRDGKKILHIAVETGHMDLCKTFIDEFNFDIHVTDNSGKSAMHYCAGSGNHQLFHYFVKIGSDINQRTNNGENCLHIAAERGYMDLCKMFLEECNFDINVTDNSGRSALLCCAANGNDQLLQYFIKMGSNIKQRTKYDENCLHVAASRGYMDLCKTLVKKYNFDIHMTNFCGQTALHCCVTNINLELFQYFLKMGSNINQRTRDGKNCLHIAAENGYMDLCKTFIDEFNFDIHVTDNSGKSAMHYCAGSGSHQLFHYFTKMGSDVHQRTKNGQNCLHIASARGYMDLCKMFLEEYNFDINVTDNSGRSALLCCAANGKDQLFQYFIKMGSNINQRTKYGENCLGYMDLCKTLVEKYNFDIHMTNFCGQTALHCCVTNINLELFQYFLKMGSNINQRTRDGKNCLHIAAEKGYMDLCKTFIDEFNFDIHVTDNSGKSAMHYCAGSGSHQLFHYFTKMGNDVNQKANNGQNCLHIASARGYMDLCKMFLEEYNFDINVTDNSGRSALLCCAANGNDQLFQYFIKMASNINQGTK